MLFQRDKAYTENLFGQQKQGASALGQSNAAVGGGQIKQQAQKQLAAANND